ncbi:hypothetical protein I7X30_06570 [Capnocytophaga sp. 051621]|uniref:TNase-like domain-containing protein n=1 Tax=Capnocytophaga periodontitidis TaxID=2795027 RepID=A0ABS0SLR7_9FLAO|nr:hypothetical protein [Capnocytophaga periodontitidis]MBI1646721.1 hypothetical protein [Capnocytophaga periodontitidis]
MKYLFLLFFLPFYTFSQSKGETYYTYVIRDKKEQRKVINSPHQLVLKQNTLCIVEPLIFDRTYCYPYVKEGKKIRLLNNDNKSQPDKVVGIKLHNNELVALFLDHPIEVVSKDELRLTGEDRPYYSESAIKAVFGNDYPRIWSLFYLNGKLLSEDNEEIKNLLEKYDKGKFKAYYSEGAKAIKKYGLKGIWGVFEINCKTKKRKQ